MPMVLIAIVFIALGAPIANGGIQLHRENPLEGWVSKYDPRAGPPPAAAVSLTYSYPPGLPLCPPALCAPSSSSGPLHPRPCCACLPPPLALVRRWIFPPDMRSFHHTHPHSITHNMHATLSEKTASDIVSITSRSAASLFFPPVRSHPLCPETVVAAGERTPRWTNTSTRRSIRHRFRLLGRA